MTRPVAPDRIERDGALTWVTIWTRRRIAALRSALSIAAVSTAYDSILARDVPSGSAGSAIAARIAMIASTQTTSIRVKPASPADGAARPTDDVGRCSTSTCLSIRAVGDDVVGAVLARRPVHIGIAPRVDGNDPAFQVRAVPRCDATGTSNQCGEAFRTRRVTPVIEEEQIECTAEAFNLDSCSLDL